MIVSNPDHPLHHEHPSHNYERLEKAEGWMSRVAVIFAVLVAAAMIVGLFMSTGGSGNIHW